MMAPELTAEERLEAILAADRVVLDINSGVWYANLERN